MYFIEVLSTFVEDGAAEGEGQEDGEKGEEGADDPPAEGEGEKC